MADCLLCSIAKCSLWVYDFGGGKATDERVVRFWGHIDTVEAWRMILWSS